MFRVRTLSRKAKTAVLITLILISVSLADGVLTALNFNKVRGSVKIFDNDDNLIYESINGLEGYQSAVDISLVPEHTIEAVVSAEDERFFKHVGFDVLAIIRALHTNVVSGRIISGGSTITQQVARDNLVYPLKNKYVRKIREINSAIYLEVFYSKNKILEKYLTNIYFGNNSYGIESAAQNYFSKPASHLTLGESAALAGSIKSPVVLNPSNPDEARGRRDEVLESMKGKGYITKEQYDVEISYPLGLNLLSRQNKHMHLVEYSLQEVKELLKISEFEDLQGYEIKTTISSSISDLSQLVSKSQVNKLKVKHKLTNASVVVLDAEDSAILAMVGSVDYFDESIDGAVNVATSERQPGSALKPFTYGQAFYEGKLSPEDSIVDEKTTFVDKKGESFVPYNYNGEFNGEVSVRTALASSLNLPAVKVLEMVGVEDMISAAQRAGVRTLDNPERYDLSVTLGGGEVTLLDLTNAYNSLARGGKYKDVYSVAEIKDHTGNVVYEHQDFEPSDVWGERSSEISETLFSILSDANAKVLGFGRNNVLILPFKAASKTGTTTDWHDNWTFGYTHDYSVGVWVGNSDNSPMYAIDGVTGAGPIWREIMTGVNDVYNSSSEMRSGRSSSWKELESEDSGSNEYESNVEERKLSITNPARNSKYYQNPNQTEFERIAFEVSLTKDVYYVEYILDEGRNSTAYKKDNFKYLWSPEKGHHNLIARFYNLQNEVMGEAETTFLVL